MSQIDLRDQAIFLEQMRNNDPIFKISDNYWVFTKYEDIKNILKNPNLVRQMKESYEENYIHSLLNLDGEDHSKYRKILIPFFSNSSIVDIENQIQNTVYKKLKEIKNKDVIDVVADIAFPVPFSSICHILGVEISDQQDYSFIADWTSDAMLVLNTSMSKEDYKNHIIGTEKVFTYLVNMLYGKKFKKTPTGVFTYLKNYSNGGESLSNEEIVSLCIMLFIGGFETNLNTFTSLVYEFVQDKQMANNVLKNIESKNTIDELFRHSSSLNFITRRVKEETVINNIKINKGDYVILHIASANRDSDVFELPHRINPHRHNASSHLAFGGGVHYCLGANLSRVQIKNISKYFISAMDNRAAFLGQPTKNKNSSMNGYRQMLLKHYYN